MRAEIDEPLIDSVVDPLSFFVRGWAWLGADHANLVAVEAWSGDVLLGATRVFYPRPDVTAVLSLPASVQAGFEFFGHHPSPPFGDTFELDLKGRLRDGSRSPVLARIRLRTIARDYRTADYGVMLDRRTIATQREANIFATGPSVATPSPELAALLRRYIGAPPRRLIDVGCGIGSYGRGLLADGYDWTGVDIDAADCAELARLGLPHRHVDGKSLPFADAAFDAALCLEVLEHIDEPRPFLREIQRVAPRKLVVSVPNCELLSYLSPHLAIPWHMLESTHVNYFTRWSLTALLGEFYPEVEVGYFGEYRLRTVEGTPLYYHLLAIATAP